MTRVEKRLPLRGEIGFVQLHVDQTGETGLQADSAARAEDITVVRKQSLIEPRGRLRQLSDRRVCELASKVTIAMGCAIIR